MAASRIARALRPALAAGLCCCASGAQAAIIGTCTIVVNAPGAMAPNPAITTLSSKAGGGSAASLTVTMNSAVCILFGLIDCYSVSAPPPAYFDVTPNDGGTGVSFLSTYRINGGAEIPGATPTRRANGSFALTVDLVASRASGVFPAGDYEATVLVRCE